MANSKKVPIKFYALKERDVTTHKDAIGEEGVFSMTERHLRFGIGDGKWIMYDDETRATFNQTTEPTEDEAVLGDTWYNPDTKELKELVQNVDTDKLEWQLVEEGKDITQQIITNSLTIENFENFVQGLTGNSVIP